MFPYSNTPISLIRLRSRILRTPRIWNLFDQAPRWVAKAGEFVDLKEVYPPVPDADKIQFVEMDDLGEKAYAKKKQEYKKLFLR